MLDQNDLKQIGTLLQGTESKLKEFVKENNKELTKEIVEQVVVGVGEFIDQNILPAIDTLIEEKLEEKLETKIEEKLTDKLRPLPDRDFITRQTAEVKGEFVAKLRKEDEKVDLHVKFSHENKVLTEQQWKALRGLHVFPSIEV